MSAIRIRAIILEGPADAATIAIMREAMESPELSIVFALPTVAAIAGRVAYETGVTMAELAGDGRCQRLFRPRCAVALLARRLSGKSTPQIGVALGGRDHATIMRQIDRAVQFEANDPAFRLLLKRVTAHFEQETIQ